MFIKHLTKADIVLFCILVVLGAASSAYFTLSGFGGGSVTIESDKKPYATYSLDEDRNVTVKSHNGTNVVTIKDGQVRVSESDCKNQVCVEHAPISSQGEVIVCLPHRLVVTIENKGGVSPDVITG